TALTYVLFLSTTLHPPDLHSFPTRRSSDLEAADVPVTVRAAQDRVVGAAGLEVRPVVHREAGGVEVGGAVEPELDGEGMAGPHGGNVVELPSLEEARREPAARAGEGQVPGAVEGQVVRGVEGRQSPVAERVVPVHAVLHHVGEILRVDAAR